MNSEILRDFSNNSSIHGFRELYHAKSIFWKTIWFLVILTAIGLSLYQLTRLVKSSIEEPTTTVINPLSGEMEYPPFSICYLHWSFWVNWSLVEDLGFDKKSAFYGFSFFGDVTSETYFDWIEAKKTFIQTMNNNGFSKLIQFYQKISNENPPGFKMFSNFKFDKHLDLSDLGTLCYTISKETIKENFMNTSVESNEIRLEYFTEYFHSSNRNLTPVEFGLNMYGLMKKVIAGNSSVTFDMSKVAATRVTPKLKMHNVDSFILLEEGTYVLQATISSTLNVWLNNGNPKCNDDTNITKHYGYCKIYCRAFATDWSNKCIDLFNAWLLGIDMIENVCENDIIFHKTNITMQKQRSHSEVSSAAPLYESCVKLYCTMPCRDWKHTSTITKVVVPSHFVGIPLNTQIKIYYPGKASVLEMTQIRTHNWETLFGNVGGIVGLWLGASVMSVIQLVYLLCCKRCDRKEPYGKRRTEVPTFTTVQNRSYTPTTNLNPEHILVQHYPYEDILFDPYKFRQEH